MLSKEILRKIHEIEIKTTQKVTEVFAGRYESVFKGRGMEFDEVREYSPGDDTRSIDWNVTARMGRPFVKRFVEERELSVMLMLDASLSCRFGTRQRLKIDLAAEVCSVLAFCAIANNVKVGLIIFTDKIEKFIYPQKGTEHVLRLIRETLCFKAQGAKTDISQALGFLDKVTVHRNICFIISDFFSQGYKKALSIASKKHDVITITILDPSEQHLSKVGMLKLSDAETGEDFLIDTTSKSVTDTYSQDSHKRLKELDKMFASLSIDSIRLYTDKPYIEALVRFFDKRQARLAAR